MYMTLYQRLDEIFSSFSVLSRGFVQKELSARPSQAPALRWRTSPTIHNVIAQPQREREREVTHQQVALSLFDQTTTGTPTSQRQETSDERSWVV